MIGKHCPIFAVNREVLIPIAKPTGYTGADPYKISFQVGREKFLILRPFLIDHKSSEVPTIDVHLISVNGSGILNIGQNVCLSDAHGLMQSFILSVYILQPSRDKLARNKKFQFFSFTSILCLVSSPISLDMVCNGECSRKAACLEERLRLSDGTLSS
ncbi:hypothetical protein SLA2020_070930 [Shorea laevis]